MGNLRVGIIAVIAIDVICRYVMLGTLSLLRTLRILRILRLLHRCVLYGSVADVLSRSLRITGLLRGI